MKNPLHPFAVARAACVAIIVFILPVSAGAQQSLEELEAGAAKGDAQSQLFLGDAYANGRSNNGQAVKAEDATALKWYQKAAAQGEGHAMARIGEMYEEGKGVEKNLDKAVEWYKKAMASHQQTFVEGRLLALSRAGLIKEKLAGIPVEGGLVLSDLDDTTPLPDLVKSLSQHTDLIETGKAYWIGYNPVMLSIAARGEAALPVLADYVKQAKTDAKKEAGLLAIHLIGIDSTVSGRFEEDFTDRKARETLWALMKVEGLTDSVSELLKRDPWPADVPAYMDALAAVKDDCPGTLNALRRYHIEKMPIDRTGLAGFGVHYSIPASYNDREHAQAVLDGIKSALKEKVVVEEGALDHIQVYATYGGNPHAIDTNVGKALDALTGYEKVFDYVEEGRAVFYYDEGDDWTNETLHICAPATAKKRLLDWWAKSGKAWYVNGGS